MSVYSLEGLPGSGKTLYIITKIIAPILTAKDMSGRWTPSHIYHNIEGLKPAVLCAILGVPETHEKYLHQMQEITDETTGETWDEKTVCRYFYCRPFSRHYVGKDTDGNNKYSYEIYPENTVFILDETQNYFNSRDFKSDYSREVIDYISRHRHYLHTIWWITQSVDSVDITFRRQTEQVLVLRRLENWGSKNSAQVQYYQGWDSRTLNPYMKKTFSYDTKFFQTYNSYVNGLQGAKERRYSHNVFLNSKGLRIVGIILLIVIAFGFYQYKKNGNTFLPMANKKQNVAPAPAPQQATGFTPAVGGAGVSSSSVITYPTDTIFYKSSYILDGKTFYILPSGATVQHKGGKYYEKSI